MTAPMLGCIADDYTGATDLSSMLVRAGLRVIQCFGTPDAKQLSEFTDADAVVVSLKSRSIPADEAVELSLEALRFLQHLGIERFFFKYCSTFDSTPQGNIGPVADALAEAIEADEVIFCPSFPENGRTVDDGNLFVGGVPLSESGMRNHPLNPMTDSNLVRVLQAQSARPVESLGCDEAWVAGARRHVIADATTNQHLQRIATITRNHPLLTGGSAIAQFWAEELLANTGVSAATIHNETQRETAGESRSIVLAGSCSDATREQVAAFESRFPVLHLGLESDDPQQAAAEVLAWCETQWSRSSTDPLLISSSAIDTVSAARGRWGEQHAAELVEQIFASIAAKLVDRGVDKIIVAGGETSGAVINSLQIKAIRIGGEIAPGVPWVQSTHPPYLSLALKSGNFGGPRFFLDALECAP